MGKNIVIVKDGNSLMTTSKVIADVFEKPHRDVTKAINSLDCSEKFSLRNFSRSEYTTDRGKTYKCFNVTEQGFYMLAMGFTGKKAAEWKEAFLDEFSKLKDGVSLLDELNKITKESNDDMRAASIAGKVLCKYKKVKVKNKKLCDAAYKKVQLTLGFEG